LGNPAEWPLSLSPFAHSSVTIFHIFTPILTENMSKNFEDIYEIATLASGATGTELYFNNAAALRVVTLCTQNLIAVLGIEIFGLRREGLQTKGCSVYRVRPNRWVSFVETNNGLAQQFLTEHRSATDVYILTTASGQEFRELTRSS
jgi:hypothetical protein